MTTLFQASSNNVRAAHILARVLVVAGAFYVVPSWTALITVAICYHILMSIGLSTMLHRYYSHKSFEFKSTTVKWLFTWISVLALRGSPIAWAYIHRQHHQHVDTEEDPHTPVGHKFSPLGLPDRGHASDKIDVFKIRGILTKAQLRVNQYYWLLILAVILPLAAFDFTAFYYMWLLPVVLVQLSINMQNYLGHMPFIGSYRNYEDGNTGQSQNSFLLWPLYFGEAWHNNHHDQARPYHYGHGISGLWWEVDPAAALIRIVGKDLVE